MTKYLAAAAAALAVMAGWSAYMKQKGVQSERVRVEAIGKKTDARAKVARKKAEEKPHDSLRAWCRDC
jgi:hypothetical protein